MPGDRRRPKCNWERGRRERLNVSFFKLSKLLPDHDPTLTLAKIEIITKATEYIQQLKNENMQLIIDSDNITGAQKNEMNHLKERVTNLLRRTRQLADLLQAADIPIPSDMPPHESEYPLKRPSKWSGRIKKDTAKEILENMKKKRDEKEAIRKEKQKLRKEKKINSLIKPKKSKNNAVLSLMKVTEKCPMPDLSGNITTMSNTSAPLREINNSMPEKTLMYPKTLTVPCTTISLVISNTKTSIVSVAKSNILTAPIMATGIQPVLQRNPALSNLGPGTLILPDGRIVPVPPPAPTVLTAATQFIVNRPTQPAVIVMQNNVTSVKQGKSQRVLVPKPKTKDSTKTTFVNKVPIPAIKTYDTHIHVSNKIDQVNITNFKKQKIPVKTKKTNSKLNIIVSESNKPSENIKNASVSSDKIINDKNSAMKINSDQKKSIRCKKRIQNNDDDNVSSKRIKINEKDKNKDKLEDVNNKIELPVGKTSLQKNNQIRTDNQRDFKRNKKDTDSLGLNHNESEGGDNDKVQLNKLCDNKGNKNENKIDPLRLEQKNISDVGTIPQSNNSHKSLDNNMDINKSQADKNVCATTDINFVSTSDNISYGESTNKNIIGTTSDANLVFPDIIDTVVDPGNSFNQINFTGPTTVDGLCNKSTEIDNQKSTVTNDFISSAHPAISNSLSSFDSKSNQDSVSHKVFSNNSNTIQINDLTFQTPVNSNTLNNNVKIQLNQTSTGQKTGDLKSFLNCPSKTGNPVGQNVSNAKSYTNQFSVHMDQKTNIRTNNSKTHINYPQQINVDTRGVQGTLKNQSNNIQKVADTVGNPLVSQQTVQGDNETRSTLAQNPSDKLHNTKMSCVSINDHGIYQLPIGVHLDNDIYQTSANIENISSNSKHNTKESFVHQNMDNAINTSNYSIHKVNTNNGTKGTNLQIELSSLQSNKFESPAGSAKKNVKVHPTQQTNINVKSIGITKTQNDSVHQTIIDFQDTAGTSKNVQQSSVNMTESIGSSGDQSVKLPTTDFSSSTCISKNSQNSNSVNQGNISVIGTITNSRNLQNDQGSLDFKYATDLKSTSNDHFIHQHNTNANISMNNCTSKENDRSDNLTSLDFRGTAVSSKSNLNNHSSHQINTDNSINAQNNQSHPPRVDFRGNNSKNVLHVSSASQAAINVNQTVNSDVSCASLNISHNIHQTGSSANVSSSNSSVKSVPDIRCTVDTISTLDQTSLDFRNHTFIDSKHPVYQVNRPVTTFTGTQSDKMLFQGNTDYRNTLHSCTGTLNNHLVCQSNIDFRGHSSNSQNDNSIHQMNRGVSKSNSQTNMDFRNSVSNTMNNQNEHPVHQTNMDTRQNLSGPTKNDSFCQMNTNFRVSANTSTNTNQHVSTNTDAKGPMSAIKNTHISHVPDHNLDFRNSAYNSITGDPNSSILQSSIDTQNPLSSSNIQSSNDNFSHQMNLNKGTNQSSMNFKNATYNSNNSTHATSLNHIISKQNQLEKHPQLSQSVNEIVSISKNSINQTAVDVKCNTTCNYPQVNSSSIQKLKDVNVPVSNNQNVQSSINHKSTQIGKNSKSSVQLEHKNSSDGNFLNVPPNQQMSNKDDNKEYTDVHSRGKNILQEKERTKNVLNTNSFNLNSGSDLNNSKQRGFSNKNNDLGSKLITKDQNFNEDKTKEQKHEFNTKKPDHSDMLTESMKLHTCTENVFRDLNYRDRNTFMPINCMDEMRLTLSNTDFSNDLFSSLQVPSGGQHPESISPTAAFLLAFPLVSTSKTSEMLAENENSDSQHATPTTILQIGNIEPPGSEIYQSVENNLQFQNNVKTKHDDKADKQLKPVDNFGKFQQFEINDRISQNYTHFRNDENFDKNSCKQKKSNFITLQDQELFLPCDKKNSADKNCPYLSQNVSGNFTNVEFQTRNLDIQNVQQNNSTNQNITNQKKTNSSSDVPTSQYSYNQPYYSLFSSNNDFSASVTSNFTTTQASIEPQKVTTQNSNQNNFSSVLSWTMPMTTASTSHHDYTTPYTTFTQKTQPYLNHTNTKQNQLQNFERKEKQNSSLPKFSTNFQFGNNTRNDLTQYQANENQINFKDSKSKKSKANQPRPPVNWMTTPDIRPVLSDHMTAILPDVMFPTKDLDLIPPQSTILNSCGNIPPFNIPSSIPNNQTFYPNSHFSGIDLPLDLPHFPEISSSKQNRNNQQSSQYSWSPNKTTIPLLPHLDSHTLAIPSTLPTLVGDLALGTNTGPPTPAENFKTYSLPNNFTGSTVKRCDTKQQELPKNQNKLPDKDCLINSNSERRNTTRTDYCKTHSNQSTNTSGSFLSVSQLVDHVKSDRNAQRRNTKQTVCKPTNVQKRSNVPTDKHNIKNVTSINNYPLNNNNNNNNNGAVQRKNDNHFTDERNKSLGYHTSSNIPPPWQAGKVNASAVQFKGGNYSAESLIGVNSETNVMNHDNIPEISQFPSSNQFTNQYNSAVSTNNTYNTDFSQNVQPGTEYSQAHQSYQNCFNFTSQNSIYTSTTTAPFMESDYQLSLDSSYVFHHPSVNAACQTNQNVKDRSVQSTKRAVSNKRRDDYISLPVNQPATSFMQTPQMYPPSSQYVNARNSSAYQPISSCASGSNTTSSLVHHGTTTLTNFNLSTIFPEINDKRAVSGSNTYHTNNSKHDVISTVAQSGVRPGYSVVTDSVDNRLPSLKPGFNNIPSTQQAGTKVNPPPSSHSQFTGEGFNSSSSSAGGFAVH